MRRLLIVMAMWSATLENAPASGSRPVRADYVVAAKGNDRNTGTERRPFATLARARDAVRQKIAAGLDKDITILIRGGTYELTEALTFGPADSGTPEHAITYAAYPGERVVVSGGRKITGWKRSGGKLWTAEVPAVREGKWYFRQLYVNGQRAVRARLPNVDAQPPFFQLAGAELSQDAQSYKLFFSPGQMKTCQNVSDVEAVVLGEWEIMRKRVQSIDEASGVVVLAPPHVPLNAHPWNRAGAGRSCYLENAAEFLDQPGEWYLDRGTGVVSYWPLPGQDMTRAEIVAPALTRLLEVKGTADKPVRNLRFSGLCFEHTLWSPPESGYQGTQACHFTERQGKGWGWGIIEPALRWEFAESCSLADGELSHLEGVGLFMGNGCTNNVLEGNHLFDIGGNGVMVGGPKDPSAEVTKNNRIASNYVHGCGVSYHGAVGIWVGLTEGTIVAHNLLHDLPYTGISVGWQWNAGLTSCKNNRIEYNHIHDVMKLLSDGGGIYTLGNQPGTVLRGNLIHDIRRTEAAVGAPNNGMFIDEGSKGFLFERNVIYGTSGAPVRHNQNQPDWHTWVDNLFGIALPAEGRIGAGLRCDGSSSFLEAPHSPSLEPKHLTIEAWISLSEYPAGPDTRRWIVNKNRNEWAEGHYALVINKKEVGAYLNIGGGEQNCFAAWSSDGPLSLNRWHHLAMTYDGSSLKVYCNADPVAATTINRERIPGDTSLVLGRRQDAYNYFKGVIDEVRLYDRALTPAQVRAHCKHPEITDKDGLISAWGFEDLAESLKAVKELETKAGPEPRYRKRLMGNRTSGSTSSQ